MFDEYLERWQANGVGRFYAITLGGGLALLMLTGWIWWHFSYLNPQTVFWGVVSNNLATVGVTKHIVGDDSSGQLDQNSQITLGASNFVMAKTVVVQQQAGSAKATVTTETMGTPQSNYARYVNVDTTQKGSNGKPLNFSPILGLWSKQDLGGPNSPSGSFADAVFGIIPLAHLNSEQRHQVVNDLQAQNTYNIDFTKVSKVRANGRLYYNYNLAMAPDKYITLLKQIDGFIGLNQLKNLDPSKYQGGQPIQIKIGVDAYSHQLSSVTFVGNQRQESYSGWGAQPAEKLPTNTITQATLQTKLGAILAGQ